MDLTTKKEAMNFISNVIKQGDDRYNAFEDEEILSDFLINKAVSFEEKEISGIETPEKLPKEVQASAKYLAKCILKKEGFEELNIIPEVTFEGCRPDIYAESSKKSVAVECYSCKVHKIIDFLSKIDEVWVITRGLSPWERIKYLKENMKLFVFKKGENWNEFYSKYQNKKSGDIRKIKSPLD